MVEFSDGVNQFLAEQIVAKRATTRENADGFQRCTEIFLDRYLAKRGRWSPMLVNDKLWEAIALGITAEDRKIRLFIHHNLSRGVAREALLRNIVVQHTIHPYCVRSGFVHTD